MNYRILYNPFAGSKLSEEKLSGLAEIYENNISYHNITKISDYTEFFSSLEDDDIVVLCGGDGTLNRFINDTEGIEIKNDILYYGKGSGNDFLRDVEKTDATEPFSIKEYIKDLPVVEVNGKTYRFINNVGFGIDGYCCQVSDEQKNKSDKPVNYTAIAITGLLFHYKPTAATVTVDGKSYEYKKVWIAPTMKGRFYGGGMIPTPNQDRNDPDGKLSVMIFYGKGRIKTLIAFPSIFKGQHVKHTDMVSIHEGKEISVTFDSPAPLQIDGETILGVTSYKAFAKATEKTNA